MNPKRSTKKIQPPPRFDAYPLCEDSLSLTLKPAFCCLHQSLWSFQQLLILLLYVEVMWKHVWLRVFDVLLFSFCYFMCWVLFEFVTLCGVLFLSVGNWIVSGFCGIFFIGMVFLLADGCEVRGRWRWPTVYVCSPSHSLLRLSPVDICSVRIRASCSSFLVLKC